jgi:hypothetical protein
MEHIGRNLTSFEELLHEKTKVKQLFDITQVENGASLAKVKNSLNGLHYGFGAPVDQIKVICGASFYFTLPTKAEAQE